MKAYGFDLKPNLIRYNSSIRNKINVIQILIEVSRWLNILKPKLLDELSTTIEDGDIRVIIYIDKMSRIFIMENDKIHSFNFPFELKVENDKYIVVFKNIIINNATCSILYAIFDDIFDCESIEKILEQYWNIAADFLISAEEGGIYAELITHLLSFEPGYLRFDHDETRSHLEFHPQDHIDIGYSSGVTYKLGLRKRINVMEMIDVININTPCMFITDK